jgi:hypothetical protein
MMMDTSILLRNKFSVRETFINFPLGCHQKASERRTATHRHCSSERMHGKQVIERVPPSKQQHLFNNFPISSPDTQAAISNLQYLPICKMTL